MNVEECARLVAMVRSLYPAQRFDENPQNVVQAWGYVVADLTFVEAQAAVVRLARRAQTWVSPGEIRVEVARARNALAPSADSLLADVREVASRQGVGRRLLHPVASQVYDAVGGAEGVKRLDSRGLLQLRRTIENVAETYDAATLADDLPPARPALSSVAEKIAAIEQADRAAHELEGPVLHPETAEALRKMRDDFGRIEQ